MKRKFACSLSGREIGRSTANVCTWKVFDSLGTPTRLSVDGKKVDPSRWRESIPTAISDGVAVWDWEDRPPRVAFFPGSENLAFTIPEAFTTAEEGFAMIEPLSFEVAVFGSVFFTEWHDASYEHWGFGRSHVDHGWGCAFRGAGHDRLVSRRWLDFGPWRVIRRSNDTTFIQFHDLAITDPAEAYAQAAPGHQRMGNDKIGGYLQHNLGVFLGKTPGLYIPETRTLEIVVAPGIEVAPFDMLRACAERLHHRLTDPPLDRIDHIAYVFVDKADAQAHLHELWLRELQCWYLDERGKHRLDHDYHPVPEPPAWVRALDGR